jgi:hypothetical protein
MKDVVIKRREMLLLSPNERYSVPDNIATQMITRGVAEEIKADILTQEKLPDRVEEKHLKKGKKVA